MTAHPTADRSNWAATPERGSLSLLRFMTWCSLKFGRQATRLLLHPITIYFLLSSPKGRRASRSYLEHALRRPVRWPDLYRHFLSFASTIHDRTYLINCRFDQFEFEIHGEHLLEQGNGLFLMGAHLGSF